MSTIIMIFVNLCFDTFQIYRPMVGSGYELLIWVRTGIWQSNPDLDVTELATPRFGTKVLFKMDWFITRLLTLC